MIEPYRIKTDTAPRTFINLGNGNWYYNYDIQSLLYEDNIIYSFVLIKLYGKPDYKRCVESIIRLYISQSLEFDIINSYNSMVLGIIEDNNKVKNDYLEYLTLLLEIKSKIKKDFQ